MRSRKTKTWREQIAGTFSVSPHQSWSAGGVLQKMGGLPIRWCLLSAGIVLVALLDFFPWTLPTAGAEAPGTWTNTGNLTHARTGHTTTRLADGLVLVAGGHNGASLTNIAELYNPATGTWTTTGSLVVGHSAGAGVRLPDGRVLVAGGHSALAPNNTTAADLYDPATGTWSATGNTVVGHGGGPTLTLLPNGKVLMVGGATSGGGFTATAELYNPATGTWSLTGSLTTGRWQHSATLLPDGRVLVAGGENYTFCPVCSLNSVEIYNPATGTWSTAATLSNARAAHVGELLPNGKVLVAGGNINASGASALTSAELYDSVANTWSATGALQVARTGPSGVLLPSGKVLVAGGNNASGTEASAELYDTTTGTFALTGSMSVPRIGASLILLGNGRILAAAGSNAGGVLNSAELYCPEMPGTPNTWMETGSMGTVRFGHTATRLPNGKVLVVGGTSSGASGFTSSELYDPQTGIWSSTGAMATGRYSHTATLLLNGKVLVTGGWNGFNVAAAELYDPQTGTWSSAGAMGQARHEHRAVLLPNGKVLVTGGSLGAGVPTASAELYDPQTDTWNSTTSMAAARYAHTAVLLPTGKVLAAAGWGPGFLASAELYDPQMGTWSSTGSLVTARLSHATTLLPNGKVLVAGGSASGGATASAELYDPQSGTWSGTGSLAQARSNVQYGVVLLPNGKALVAGGEASGFPDLGELYDFSAGMWVSTDPITSVTARGNLTVTLLANGQVLVAGGWNSTLGGQLASAELFSTAICEAEEAPTGFFLHGSGGTANPSTLFLDSIAPTATTAKYKDSSSINFNGGNPWKDIGTWIATPSQSNGNLTALSDLHVWVGLKNSDDQGTQFDVRAEVYQNTTLVAFGETRCITGVTRNQVLAKAVTVAFPTFLPKDFNGTSDVLNLKVRTRVGTNPDSTKCSGPGGSHNNAVGLRLYFDATSRAAEFVGTFAP